MHGYKHYEARLRQSQRMPYVVARRVIKASVVLLIGVIALFLVMHL